MAAATLSYSNHQLNDQAWSSESSLITTKSQDSNPEWGQNENPTMYPSNNEPNPSMKSPTQSLSENLPTEESTERDDNIYLSQEEKNREIREYLKNMPCNIEDPEKAQWANFKNLIGQESQEKASLAYLSHLKNEQIFALLQAYRQHEDKYNWNVERQKIKDEQFSHFKHMTNFEETLQNSRNHQTNCDIDYFKNKWDSYALPSHPGISPDMYREILQKGRQALLSSQENLELLQQNYSHYNNLVQENQHNGHIHSTSVQDVLDVDGSKFYNYNQQNLQLDPKLQNQYLHQQKVAQPITKRIGNKGDSNALDDVMADFQANGHDSAAPSSPRASRCWPTPRPSLQGIRHLMQPSTSAAANAAMNPMLASPLTRSTEADLLRQLMLMNLGATSQLQNQQLYAQQAYGFPLGGLDGQFRQRRRVTVTPTECAFCRNNGEQPAVYRGHILKDPEGRVRCPILRDYTCRNCGATGDLAHTVKYCPLTPKTEKFTYGQRQEAGFAFRPAKMVPDQPGLMQNPFAIQNP